MNQGREDEAFEIFDKAAGVNITWRYFGLGLSLIRADRLVEGRKILNEFEALPLNGYRALMLAAMYSELGDFDRAIEYLNYPQKHGWFPWIRIMFLNPEMRDDPRFLEIIRAMNLPDPGPLAFDPSLALNP